MPSFSTKSQEYEVTVNHEIDADESRKVHLCVLLLLALLLLLIFRLQSRVSSPSVAQRTDAAEPPLAVQETQCELGPYEPTYD